MLAVASELVIIEPESESVLDFGRRVLIRIVEIIGMSEPSTMEPGVVSIVGIGQRVTDEKDENAEASGTPEFCGVSLETEVGRRRRLEEARTAGV